MMLRLFATIAFTLFLAATARGAPRVALMDFSVDDNSYRSAQEAAEFTSLLQIQLADAADVEWVERAQIKRIREEFELSTVEGLSGMHSLRQGKLAKADWMITGQFSVDDRNRRTLYLEITSLQDADVLASRIVTFLETPAEGTGPNMNQIGLAVSNLRQLLAEAKAKSIERASKTLIVPLFFADLTGLGEGVGRSEVSENLAQPFSDLLERAAAENTNLQLINFPKAYRSLDESEMVLDGLVDTDQQSWRQTADLYVWGTYVVTEKFIRGQKPVVELEITLHLWDGSSLPTQITEKLPATAGAAEIQATLGRLVKQVIVRSKPATRLEAESARKEIAQSLLDAYDRMTLKRGQRDDFQLYRPEKFLEAVHMLETACFFDPDNAKARLLYITCRWGRWMDFKAKNEFWSKLRRSQAVRDYVTRFGLGPVDMQLPFPYQQQGGIRSMYIGSLEDVLSQLPQWRSVEGIKSEDEDRKYGMHTPLQEAELHGFPKDLPRDLAWEWKIAAQAELAQRRKSVADFNAAQASVTNSSKALSNAPAIMSAAKTNVVHPVNSPPPKRIPQTPGITQPLSQRIVTPLWVRQFSPNLSIFRLFPPSSLPMEVKPEVGEIKFPTQFQVQSVLQIGSLNDKLLILAVDERSAPSSEITAEVSAELLDQRGRLWVLEPGASSPVLFRVDLFPQSVSSFLVADDRLWFAGKTTGYLDLKTEKIRKFGLADGFTLQTSSALASVGGKVFATASFFKVCSMDPASEKWIDVAWPRGRVSGSSDFPVRMAGYNDWIGFATGSAVVCDAAQNSWTNLPGLGGFMNVTTDENGFWFGAHAGLISYEPDKKSLKIWGRPGTIQGMTPLGANYNANFQILQSEVNQISNKVQGFMRKMQKDRAETHDAKLKGVEIDPLGLKSRIPGGVTAMANDGDFLWLGAGDCLLLLHKPSGSLVAHFNVPGGPRISSIAVSRTFLWVGTTYGDSGQRLLQISKDPFLSVPRNEWLSLTISPEEWLNLIRGMNTRDQAVYAFFSADDNRVVELLGGIDPAEATLEERFLLAFSYDTLGLDQPELARFWFERIIARDPGSPWAKVAQDALSASVENHRTKAYAAGLIQKYDRNHDGVLDETESAIMKKDPVYQEEQKTFGDVELQVQTKAIFDRYDANKDGKLDSDELATLVTVVRTFSDAPPEMLRGRTILVAPLLSKDFPQVPALLKKYDVDRDGTLSLDELRALANDIKRPP
jgi:Ca2+-binding EF-hand superfamily protein